jgi:hypothetical protein
MVTDKSEATLSGGLGESACVLMNRTDMRLGDSGPAGRRATLEGSEHGNR